MVRDCDEVSKMTPSYFPLVLRVSLEGSVGNWYLLWIAPSVFDACSDAIINPKTLYSNCQTIISGCILYTDFTLQTVVSEIYVFHQGANWDLNGSGFVIGLSSTQC